jgi:hypothetical protein
MNFKVYVFVMFKMKYFCSILPQQVGWLEDKGICFHSKGQGIKPNGWCCVWSTMVC